MRDITLVKKIFRKSIGQRDQLLVLGIQSCLVFFLVTLSLTSASIQEYLTKNLQSLLGSDMVIAQHYPLTTGQLNRLRTYGTVVSETTVQVVNITRGVKWQRVQLKQVDNNYPVQGQLTYSTTMGGVAKATSSPPAEGEIWVDSRVAAHLNLSIGNRITLGKTTLRVGAILGHEPDRLLEGHNVEMRALVSSHSLIDENLGTGKIQHRYLIAASSAYSREAVTQWVSETLPEAQLLDRHSGQHPLSKQWQRIENFLGLVSVLFFFMGIIALHMVSRRLLEQQQYRFALYLSFGVSLERCIRMSIFEWGMIFILALAPALLLAYSAQHLIVMSLQSQFAGIAADFHWKRVLETLQLAFLVLFCNQLPLFWQLKNTAITTLIRQQTQYSVRWQLLGSSLALFTLIACYSDNWLLTSMVIAAMVSTVLLILITSWILITLAAQASHRFTGILSFAFAIMKQRVFNKFTQIFGFGLCMTLLLFSLMLMRDIGDAMHSQMRQSNGNLLISDAQDWQMDAISAWSRQTDSEMRDFHAYTPALLKRIHGRPIRDLSLPPSDSLTRLQRPIRLSWSEQIPTNNKVLQGNWWSPEGNHWQQVSVEGEVLTDLGLKLGEKISFDLEGKEYEFTIVASHDFKPGGSQITFWFRIPSVAVQHIKPKVHYMGNMELPMTAWEKLGQLLRKHPSLALTSLQEITEKFDKTMALVRKVAVSFSAAILLFSLIVVAASIAGFESDDRKRLGLLLSMGLKKRDCLKLVGYEWLITGLIAAIGAILGIWVAGNLIYSSQLSLTYNPDYAWLLSTLGISCFLVCVTGLLFCRRNFKVSIRELINE
ncbi:ABC transporter permease [Microbulbifer sp. TYP-18]|uniref:ABC transporter permease n=1 Tax=Microbulbifer sp. TYP-18 TaxID=3230024 RepID=UPI0034C6AF2E